MPSHCSRPLFVNVIFSLHLIHLRQKFGFIKQADGGRNTTMKGLAKSFLYFKKLSKLSYSNVNSYRSCTLSSYAYYNQFSN